MPGLPSITYSANPLEVIPRLVDRPPLSARHGGLYSITKATETGASLFFLPCGGAT